MNKKITHITFSTLGGCGIAVTRLNEELIKLGIDSTIITAEVYNKYYYDNNGIQKINFLFRKLVIVLKRKILRTLYPFPSTYFSFPFSEYTALNNHPKIAAADIIHLHWIGNFIDFSSFFKNISQPIIWTLHDINPITAGYHCPPTTQELKKNSIFIQRLERFKLKILQEIDIHTVYTSNFIKEKIEKSNFDFSSSTTYIPLGVQTDIFKPYPKYETRRSLNLPINKKIVLLVADSLDVPWKGFKYVLDVVNHLNDFEDIIFCTVGNIAIKNLPVNDSFMHLGFIKDATLLSKIYSSADLFISTSTFESFGQTVIESLACGTPVIGFPVGIIPDAVHDGINGYICKNFDTQELSQLVLKALKKKWNQRKISGYIIKNYAKRLEAKRYISLYATL